MPMIEPGCLELLPEAALRVDSRGAVVEANRLAEALFGPPPALTGVNGFLQWLHSDDPGVFRGRLHARRASGVPLTLALSARRLPDGQGAVCMVVEPDRERVAYEAQRHFDIAFDAAPIGMALVAPDVLGEMQLAATSGERVMRSSQGPEGGGLLDANVLALGPRRALALEGNLDAARHGPYHRVRMAVVGDAKNDGVNALRFTVIP